MIRRAAKALQNRLVKVLLSRFYRIVALKSFDAAIRHEIEDWRPDIIHAHDLLSLPPAVGASRALNVPVVFDSHELEEHRNPPLSWLELKAVRRVQRRCLSQCAAVTTVSQSIAEYLAREEGVEQPTLIHNSPPAAYRSVNPRWITGAGRQIRVDAMLSSDAFSLVYVGNLAANRGVEIVLDALPRLPSEVHLVTVGSMTDTARQRFQELIARSNIHDRVHMLDPVGPSEVVDYIAAADAAIIPVLPATLSYEFAMPNKLFEAAFAGLPIVASDILEISRFVRAHGLGVVYDPFDARDCARKIHELYGRHDRYKPSAAKIRALKDKYAWEVQEEKLGRVFSAALGGSPHGCADIAAHRFSQVPFP